MEPLYLRKNNRYLRINFPNYFILGPVDNYVRLKIVAAK